MLPYICLLGCMACMGFVKYFCRWNSRETAARMAGWVMFGIWLILALRSPVMGYDLGYRGNTETGYLQSFHVLTAMTPRQLFTFEKYLNYEFGYKILNALVGWVWENEQFFLAVCAALSIIPVSFVIRERSDAPLYSCLIYFALQVYELLFSALRQGIAIGICFYGLTLIQDRKLLKFTAVVLFASVFHSSALFFLAAYPLYHLKMGQSLRIVCIAVIPAVYLLRKEILKIYALLRPNTVIDNNGALGMLLLLTLIYVVGCFFCNTDDDRVNGYMNLHLVCCLIQTIANIHGSAMRAGYPYMISIVLLIPSLIAKMEWRLRVVAKWVAVIFFTFFALRTIIQSSWSCMYPYIPFWRDMIL